MSKPYLRIPADLIGGTSGLSPRAMATFIGLASFADYRTRLAWPSHTTLAAKIGKSVPTVERALRELRETGWVSLQRRVARGPNVYHLNEEPVLTEDEAPGAEPEPEQEPVPVEDDGCAEGRIPSPVMGYRPRYPIKTDAHNPSEMMAHSDVYTRNKKTLTALRAVAPRDGIEEGFDPAQACGLFESDPAPVPAKATGARALAYELRSAWMRERPEALPGDMNVGALGGQIAAWMRGGVTDTEIHQMIELFVTASGLQVKGAPPWKSFLAKRHLMLKKIRDAAAAEAAETDPDYWKPSAVHDWKAESEAWHLAQFGTPLNA